MISVLRSWCVEQLALEQARDLRLRDDALDERSRGRRAASTVTAGLPSSATFTGCAAGTSA